MPSQRVPKKTALAPGEQIVKAQTAFKEREVLKPTSGWLFLTNQRIVFEPSALSYSRSILDLPLQQISGVEQSALRLFGKVPIMPGSISVITRSGEDIRFHVGGAANRDSWMEALRAAIPADSTAPAAPPAKKFCSGCGAPRLGADKFCSSCGRSFEEG